MAQDKVCVAIRFKTAAALSKLARAAKTSGSPHIESVPEALRETVQALRRFHLEVSSVGSTCITFKGDVNQLQRFFAAKLHLQQVSSKHSLPFCWDSDNDGVIDFIEPLRGIADGCMEHELKGSKADAAALLQTIEAITVQQPHLLTVASPVELFPQVGIPLDVLTGLRKLLGVDEIFERADACTGKGVKVAMIDTGFMLEHPFFVKNGFDEKAVVRLCGNATGVKIDDNGHGTGESANLFSVAPGISFLGVKADSPDPDDQPYLIEGFNVAMAGRPDIISMSLIYDFARKEDKQQLKNLPPYAIDLANEIKAAIADHGTIIVAATGNGEYGFPAQMDDVIAVGGANISNKKLTASDASSAFASEIYAPRRVPDVCGLVGMLPDAAYIELPVPKDSFMFGKHAGTDKGAKGAWAAFSGTSAAAPQVAGVCALLLERLRKKGPLSEEEVLALPKTMKKLLCDGAVDVRTGTSLVTPAHPALGADAVVGVDAATGAGLVNALESFKLAAA